MEKPKESPMPNSSPEGPVRRSAPRGFAAMDADRRREIARKGGKSVPDEKRSFTQDRTLAAEAGRKGGRQTQSGRKVEGGGTA
jgi:general stress protein YciG